MSELIFDEPKLLETARAISLVNPYAANYSLDGLIENMKATARRSFDDGSHGYVATLGYVLTLWTDDRGNRFIYSSVSSHCVLNSGKETST